MDLEASILRIPNNLKYQKYISFRNNALKPFIKCESKQDKLEYDPLIKDEARRVKSNSLQVLKANKFFIHDAFYPDEL